LFALGKKLNKNYKECVLESKQNKNNQLDIKRFKNWEFKCTIKIL